MFENRRSTNLSVTSNATVNGGTDTDGPSTPRASTATAELTRRPPANVGAHQLAVALTWLRRGAPVIPCSRTEKRPLIGGFGADATLEQLAPFSDPDQVEQWWRGRYRRAHVGILTRSLVVVDLDMPKAGTPEPAGRWAGCFGGTDVLERLMTAAGAEWPETYTVLTPSGGMHLYFQQPEGEPIGCATGEGPTAPHLGPLVDVRGVGGLVIAAGSYSAAQGRPYTRVSPPDVLPRPLPGWLLELLRPSAPPVRERPPAPAGWAAVHLATRAERYAASALRGAADDVAGAAEGERNRMLFARARHLGELAATAPRVLTEQAVEEELLAAAQACGMDGGDRAALRTIRSGWARGTQAGTIGGAA
ncbi:bifunctional DNA primase/polymerase [Streptomyces sp. NPDC001380]|uniref:bifunctional DNA primase/polymerase n=1 Tax=Streptomyces sp. NPDC001380 TaxID=3364566 RepID=UPI0036BB15D8